MKKSTLRETDAGIEIDCECNRTHRLSEADGKTILETIYREPGDEHDADDGHAAGAAPGSVGPLAIDEGGETPPGSPAGEKPGAGSECQGEPVRILGFRFHHCRPECEAAGFEES